MIFTSAIMLCFRYDRISMFQCGSLCEYIKMITIFYHRSIIFTSAIMPCFRYDRINMDGVVPKVACCTRHSINNIDKQIEQ